MNTSFAQHTQKRGKKSDDWQKNKNKKKSVSILNTKIIRDRT